MSKSSRAISALHPIMEQRLYDLGQRIRIARKRRNLSLRVMANLMFTSVATVQRLEKGDPGVSMGIFITALTCLRLDKDVEHVADVEKDTVGLSNELLRLERKYKKRIGMSKYELYNF